MNEALKNVISRGLEALDGDDVEAAQAALDEATRLAGENNVHVLHLNGMIAWAEGRIDNAAGYLMQAVDAGADDPDVYLDCAECLFIHGDDLDEAEAVVRQLLARDGLDQEPLDEGRLLLAQIRLDDDDPDESLELLEEVSEAMHEHPAFLSTQGAVMMALGRHGDAVHALERAVEQVPEDADLHYQLGLTREAAGDAKGASAAMLKVLELDEAEIESEPVTDEEVEDLQARLEEVLEEVPDRILRLVAQAPISIQARPTADQVRAGVNPRGVVAFLGRPRADDREAELTGIAVMRDLVVDAIDDDDEISEVLFVGFVEELRRFFQDESLGVASIEDVEE